MVLRLFLGPRPTSAASLTTYLLASCTGEVLDFGFAEDGDTRPAGLARVPSLVQDDSVVWEPSVIAEFLAETYPAAGLIPASGDERIFARALIAEMTLGTQALRTALPLDLVAAGKRTSVSGAAKKELQRLDEVWREALRRYPKRPFVFGKFSAVDAFATPLAITLVKHGCAPDGEVAEYLAALLDWPETKRWIEKAKAGL